MPRAAPRLDVLIIGGGAAGLACAFALALAGRSVLVLEARNRLGGRILTLKDADSPAVELGAEFIHGRPKATWELIKAAGLLTLDVPFEHLQRKHGRLARLDDFSEAIKPVMAGLARLKGPDVSFQHYLDTHARAASLADARAMARAFVEGFDAADPAVISARSLAKEQEGLGDVGEQAQFRILQGYGALIDWMADRAIAAGAQIKTGAIVNAVEWGPAGAAVHGERRGRRFRIEARRVVVTLPLGVLKRTRGVGAVAFMPDIDAKRAAMEKLASGGVVKTVLILREPFWESARAAALAKADESYRDLSFMNDPAAEIPTWWTLRPLRTPVLIGWAGGPKAAALSGLGGPAIVQAGLESLSRLTGLRPATLGRLVRRVHVFDWPASPWSRGAYSYEAVGGSRARAELAKPLGGSLYFAGEATDTQGQASTVAGALASGARAAAEVLRARAG